MDKRGLQKFKGCFGNVGTAQEKINGTRVYSIGKNVRTWEL